MDERDAARVAPSDADLERAIASVPGVVSATVRRSAVTGRSSLRIRLGGGEDAEKVSWAVAATLRERFSIVLDPDDIRPLEAPASQHREPEDDPVRIIQDRPSAPPGAPVAPEPATEPAEGSRRDPTAPLPTAPSPVVAADAAARGDETVEALTEDATEPDARPEPADLYGDGSGEGAQRSVPAGGSSGPGREPRSYADSVAEMLAALVKGARRDPPDAAQEREAQEGAPKSEAEAASEPEPGSRSDRLAHVGNPWPGPQAVEPDDAASPRVEHGEVRAGATHDLRAGAEGPVAQPKPSGDIPPGDDDVADHDASQPAGEVMVDAGDEGATLARAATSAVGSLVAVPGGMTGRVVAERAAIRHLDTERHGRDVRVAATLQHGGRTALGEVTTVPTTHGVMRAVAEATLVALGVLVGPSLIAGVDRISIQPADDPANALVTVSLLTDRGEEMLLGSSVVRGDPQHAVMRATLDALNRRVAVMFSAPDQPAGGRRTSDGSMA